VGGGCDTARGPRRLRGFALRGAGACARRPLVCLAVLSIATVAFATRLPHLELRTDGAALHPTGDPRVERTVGDRVLFEDPEELILVLTPRPGGPRLTSAAGLRALVEAHRALASLSGIRASGVRSAASLIDVATSGVGSLGTYLDEVPDEDAARESLLRRMREGPLTDGLYLASDGSAGAIYAPLDPGFDRREIVRRVERWAAGREDPRFDFRLTGPVVAETLLGERILEDLARLVPVMMLVVAAVLLFCLRTLGGLLVAMSKTLVVLVWTGGMMELAGVPITLVTTVLPVLLLALCVTDEVHVLARLQSMLAARPESGPDDEHRALLSTLDELYRPVVYTSVSTAIGFLSFLSASIVPMRQFGAFAAGGIILAMLMTFTLTPSFVVLLPSSWFRPRLPRRRVSGGEGLLGLAARWRRTDPGRRRATAFVAGLVLLVVGVPGLLRLTVQDSWIANFDPDSPLVQAERRFNASFWGTYRFDLVLSGRPGLFHRPEGAALVEAAARVGAAAPHARGVVTYLQPLDSIAELLGLSAGAAALPADALKAVVEVASEYPLRTGLHRLVTREGDAARLLVLVNSPDYRRASDLAEHVDREMALLLERAGDVAGSEVSYHASGDLPLALATVGAIVHDQLWSVTSTLAGIGLLLLLANRKPWLTLVQLVPPAAAAWLILAAMGYAGLPLGIATSMFTALTIGVGVDLALHVTYAFEHRRSAGLEPARALRAAFETTAPGRRWSVAVLSLGFLVLTVSAFGPNHDLGILLSAAVLVSYLTTSLFVPWMLAR